MTLPNIYDTSTFSLRFAEPLGDPTLKFLVILGIILFAPILLNRFRIPAILGLIIAGIIVGPYGINLLERDSGIILSGTAGLLYIMFLAGLEINLTDFKKNSGKSLLFGMYTFLIPMAFGFLSAYYVFNFDLLPSILLASVISSHTLIAYPIISKYGIAKNRSVTVTVGGTMVTNILAFLVLAAIVRMTTSEVNTQFWVQFGVSVVVFGVIVMVGFPILARWFFKRFKDSVSQYIFVLAMIFLGAVLSELAGMEGIIGAMLAGLALNRLIPTTSPLMNRVEFVGNAIFIPFFLIGVGMLVDYRAFFTDWATIKVAVVLTAAAIFAKYAAAWLTQKNLKYSTDERRVIFGLSNAQAAGTLAAVTVGYNIVLRYTEYGEPIRLLNESVLNGSIVMILISCTIATFAAQRGASNISLAESISSDTPSQERENQWEKILIPISHPENIEELINLSALIKKPDNKHGMYALNVIKNRDTDPNADKKAQKVLEQAEKTAAALDLRLNTQMRYDVSVSNAITSIMKQNRVTDLVLGLHVKTEISESFLGDITENILERSSATTYIYRPIQPISTIKRHVILIPENAETEFGFPLWVTKMWHLGQATGSKLMFYGNEKVIEILRDVHSKNNSINVGFKEFENWDDFLIISRDIQSDDNLIVVMSREHKNSYQHGMKKIPQYLNSYFTDRSFILIYPMQLNAGENGIIDLTNASLLTGKFEGFGKIFQKIKN